MANEPTPSASRRGIYYGWLIVTGYLLAGAAGSGAMLWGFQVFVTPMKEELGWSNGTIFSVILFRTLLVGVLIVFLGRLMDQRRWPPIVMGVSAVVLGLSVMGLSLVHSYWQYFLFSVVFGSIGFAGAGGQLYQALVPKWFIRLRGRAIAFGSAGTAIGAFVYPTLANITIDAYGWRTAWVVIGILTLVLLVPISVLIRRSPEDMGLLPDGETHQQHEERRSVATAAGRQLSEEQSYRPGEVLRYPTTWFIVVASMLAAPTMIGLTSNWAVHFESIGFTRGEAATIVSTYGAASLASRVLWGYFLDKHHIRTLAMVQAALSAGSIALLLTVTSFGVLAIVYGVVQGLILGGYLMIQPLIWSNFFGRAHLGAIRGTFAPFQTAVAAAAPFTIAATADSFDSYRPAFVLLLVLWLVNVGFMYRARPLPPPRAVTLAPAPAANPAG